MFDFLFGLVLEITSFGTCIHIFFLSLSSGVCLKDWCGFCYHLMFVSLWDLLCIVSLRLRYPTVLSCSFRVRVS